MRAYVPGYEIKAPATLDAALRILADAPERWMPLAGGTDVMVYFESGALPPGSYLSIWQLDELRQDVVTDVHVTLGALTTYTEVRDHPILQVEFPMLVQAASESGAIAIQNRGTLGGNIINASPAADSPPALLAYDAEVELVSADGGSRWVRYEDFHHGYKQMVRERHELLRAIRLPRRADPSAWTHFYKKVGTRKYQSISKVCVAGVARWDAQAGVPREVRIGVGSVAATVLRASRAEAAIAGKRLNPAVAAAASVAMREDVTPLDDIRSTAHYRRVVAGNVAQAFVRAILEQHVSARG